MERVTCASCGAVYFDYKDEEPENEHCPACQKMERDQAMADELYDRWKDDRADYFDRLAQERDGLQSSDS